jgi:hypothetical protein
VLPQEERVADRVRVREISDEEGNRLGVVEDISHEGLRLLLRKEGCPFNG